MGFPCLKYKSFENTVEKGEIARHEQFLLFPAVFSIRLKNFLPFSPNIKLSSANSFSLEESKICRLEKSKKVGKVMKLKVIKPSNTPSEVLTTLEIF